MYIVSSTTKPTKTAPSEVSELTIVWVEDVSLVSKLGTTGCYVHLILRSLERKRTRLWSEHLNYIWSVLGDISQLHGNLRRGSKWTLR
ncbi:hypothetical protein EB796_020356 [Bugula neritina]|uniref:Uncharacterized protein n=1 Tax=Bugula neritina TaxID=10212 RepID=A0A7J7J6H2_BUGNE|nr:hypothetical protein EB796_020356 [Bugula neritina]